MHTRMQEQMPGHPPASLQRLFHMGRKLKDSEPLGPLFEDSPLALPVILDMAPPIECVLGWVGWSMGIKRWRVVEPQSAMEELGMDRLTDP